MLGCPNCGFISDPDTGAMYDVTFPCPECREGGAVVQEGCQNCGSDVGYDRTYQRCLDCGEPFWEGDEGMHWKTGEPPPPAFSLEARIAAKYKSKKKVKPKGGKGKEFTVYEYSDAQIANRNKAKAKKVEKLGQSIGKLRTKVTKDLKSGDPETMLTALAVALMDHTYERVGNDGSADEGHFGVTGWQRKHVSWKGGASINYVGKSGVKHKKKVTDASIKKALRDAYEAADSDDANLFAWDGGSVTAEKVNAYLKPFGVTAKDIRGYHANREMQERLQAARKGKLPEDKKAREKQLKTEFLKALDETAEAVGHEAATLRSQYLVPGLEDTYMKDGTVMSKLGSVTNAGFLRIVERYLDEVSQVGEVNQVQSPPG